MSVRMPVPRQGTERRQKERPGLSQLWRESPDHKMCTARDSNPGPAKEIAQTWRVPPAKIAPLVRLIPAGAGGSRSAAPARPAPTAETGPDPTGLRAWRLPWRGQVRQIRSLSATFGGRSARRRRVRRVASRRRHVSRDRRCLSNALRPAAAPSDQDSNRTDNDRRFQAVDATAGGLGACLRVSAPKASAGVSSPVFARSAVELHRVAVEVVGRASLDRRVCAISKVLAQPPVVLVGSALPRRARSK